MIKNDVNGYGSVAKWLHWILAILLISMFVIGYVMTNIAKSPWRSFGYDIHKATGIVIFFLVALRLSWRLMNIKPLLHIPVWQKRLADANILLLYFLMFSIPLAGFLISTLGNHEVSFYYLFTIQPLADNPLASLFFSKVHELLGYVLIAAFSLHVLGALYHHFILKDEILKRMLKQENRET